MTGKESFNYGWRSLWLYFSNISLCKKKYKVKIIENSDDILSSLKPIKINKYIINNGFHGIDYPKEEKI